MSRIEFTVQFNADAERVYEALTRAENLPEVLPGIRGAKLLDGAPWGPGARILLRTASGRFREARVAEQEPGRLSQVVEESGLKDTWILEPSAHGTRAHHIVEGRFSSRARRRITAELEEKAERLRHLVDFANAHAGGAPSDHTPESSDA